jgi:hypothetical protein
MSTKPQEIKAAAKVSGEKPHEIRTSALISRDDDVVPEKPSQKKSE